MPRSERWRCGALRCRLRDNHAVSTFLTRPAVPADLPVLRDIYRRASLSNEGDAAALLAHPDVFVLTDAGVIEGRTRVATLTTDHVVGFATTICIDRVLDLEDLFVDPQWMRHGVGRLLVHDILTRVDHRLVERLEVIANPHALAFYEHVGFVHDGHVATAFGLGRRMHIKIGPRTTHSAGASRDAQCSGAAQTTRSPSPDA
jgi:GNAT superfamily N-acetyltransferase